MRAVPSAAILLHCFLALAACSNDSYETTGEVAAEPRPAQVQAHTEQAQRAAGASGHILFGDLHVHSTFSMDAFEHSLAGRGGEGSHPVADACDYARYCSQLDFWSINDHAMALTPKRWEMTRDAIRQCNAVAGEIPDTVAFTGWEWTQISKDVDTHWGHKNVIFPGENDDELPPRPIRAGGTGAPDFRVPLDTAGVILSPLKGLLLDGDYRRDHWRTLSNLRTQFAPPACDPVLDSRDLPTDCAESAATPAQLFARLDRWSDDYLVIPHGTSWGLYTPPGAAWDKQLQDGMHDPERQKLIEIYSGHGNSEEYRSWRGVAVDAQGTDTCPAPTDNYVPCCWQAGEIVRRHCTLPNSAQCEAEVVAARSNAVAAGASSHLSVAGVTQQEWLNCGQCPDCFLPAFKLRPGTSAQAALAVRNPAAAESGRFRFGFIGASDNHGSRPGTGYKELNRRINVDNIRGATQRPLSAEVAAPVSTRPPSAVLATTDNVYNRERVASMLYSGGLAAVHSSGRSRQEIWAALQRREVYATSGPRMLLWFDHIDASGRSSPMGSVLRSDQVPQFKVRAVGAQLQRPGCPQYSREALGEERLQRLCGSECHYPDDRRERIDRIEVIRVLSATGSGEDPAQLIQDPWRIYQCDPEAVSCEASFSDPEFPALQRDVSYYVRALQSASATINGAGLRCEFDAGGNCVAVNLCYADDRTATADDCLADVQHRAWSSPIYVDQLSP